MARDRQRGGGRAGQRGDPPGHPDVLEFRPANPNYRGPRLKVLDPRGLDGRPVPPREWLVRDWIPLRAVTLFGGDGGIGKTILAMQLLTCAATGRPWLGQETLACRAVGLFCEDDADELHRRQAAINRHYGIGFDALDGLAWLPRAGLDNTLMTWERFEAGGTVTELYQQVHDLCQDHGARLVVIDALYDVFGGDENRRPHAQGFVRALAHLARDCDGAVVVCAHPSVKGRESGSGESGSTAWHNAVRSRLYLAPKGGGGDTGTAAADSAPPRPPERELRRLKANYATAGARIPLAWADGAFTAGTGTGTFVASLRRRAARTAFLDCLDAVETQGRDVTDARNSDRYAPRLFVGLAQGRGMKVVDLERAMNQLFADGIIRVANVRGPDRHWRKRLVRATAADGGQPAETDAGGAGSALAKD
jgi:hypothetical protein